MWFHIREHTGDWFPFAGPPEERDVHGARAARARSSRARVAQRGKILPSRAASKARSAKSFAFCQSACSFHTIATRTGKRWATQGYAVGPGFLDTSWVGSRLAREALSNCRAQWFGRDTNRFAPAQVRSSFARGEVPLFVRTRTQASCNNRHNGLRQPVIRKPGQRLRKETAGDHCGSRRDHGQVAGGRLTSVAGAGSLEGVSGGPCHRPVLREAGQSVEEKNNEQGQYGTGRLPRQRWQTLSADALES